MEKKDNGIYHHLRLSANNPEHMKVHNALMDLNKEIYKSKNQFIFEALLFYIDALEKNPMIRKGNLKIPDSDMLITKSEMDAAVVSLRNDLTKYVNKEVLTTIISVMGKNMGMSMVLAENTNKGKNENNKPNVDERLIELASKWS